MRNLIYLQRVKKYFYVNVNENSEGKVITDFVFKCTSPNFGGKTIDDTFFLHKGFNYKYFFYGNKYRKFFEIREKKPYNHIKDIRLIVEYLEKNNYCLEDPLFDTYKDILDKVINYMTENVGNHLKYVEILNCIDFYNWQRSGKHRIPNRMHNFTALNACRKFLADKKLSTSIKKEIKDYANALRSKEMYKC